MVQVETFGERNYELLKMVVNKWLQENSCIIYNIQYQIDNGLHCAMITYNKNLFKN